MRTHQRERVKEHLIDPRQWRVIGQLRHHDVTYGTAEPLPDITVTEAALYEKQGTLMRVSDTALAESYLEGPDVAVLQTVLDKKPDERVLNQMLTLAQRNSRSKVLELALTIARGRA